MRIPCARRAFGPWPARLALAAALGLPGCTPALNWRDVRVPDGTMHLLMPCRPATQERTLSLNDRPVRLQLLSCDAADLTWAVAQAELGDPAQAGAALRLLRSAALKNVGADEPPPDPLPVPGSTPRPEAGRWRVEGRLPDGRPIQMRLALFADASRVYQVTVFGARLPDEAVETFFASLRIGP